ncbi:cold shock domain-containing protein [Streptomyces sp. B1866]|uniref:cold-shock protein n=1 Tax=Streptomyces sp. B1866 TaxID=3075431 RepID=UPI00288F3AF7|nr:cold shock domain-containing protein [Streptomyces sp. B1866]MDT3399776.1 cold shock domain-containing protein [Streptomyces sp. B1866]
MATGKVVRFDEFRGYGFIAPDNGSEDVFVHANDLLDDKYLFRPGLRVSFEVEDGERGLKASEVRLVGPGGSAGPGPAGPGGTAPVRQAAVAASGTPGEEDAEDGVCDLLSASEFQHELTEALLLVTPALTGEQILQTRRRIIKLAQTHRWVES